MVLINCTECGTEFSDKAPACPKCACPTREAKGSSKLVPSDPVKKKGSIGCGTWITGTALAIFMLIVIIAILEHTNDSTERSSSSESISHSVLMKDKIHHETVERWATGETIVISPKNRTEAGLAALGEQLKNENSDRDVYFIQVFDNKRAASLRKTFDDSNADFVSQHFIGQYFKNNGVNEFVMYLNGVTGRNHKTIKY